MLDFFCNYKRNNEIEFRDVVISNWIFLKINNIIIYRVGLVFVRLIKRIIIVY